jgi:zinc protease
MVAALLDRGTRQLSRQDLSDRLDALRSDVSFTPTTGGLRIAITSKRDTLAPTIALVGEMLRDSVFAPPMLDEIKRQVLADLAQQRKEPEALVDNALDRHDNPYPRGDVRHARSFDEMADDVGQVTPERVRAFHDRFYGASHAEFGASGDLDPASVLKALRDAFEGWASPAPYARVPDPLVPPTPVRVVIATPDKQNAAIGVRLALPVKDADADAPALMLANHMLGGGGNSRLWNRIREKGGLSYSVYSYVQWNALDAHSTWQAAAIFAPQNEAKVEGALDDEIRRALELGFNADELAAARRGLLSLRRLARAQDDRLADSLAQNLYLGRTFAQADRLDQALQTASLESVNAALRKYLQPARFAVAIGGDFKGAADRAPEPASDAAP